VVFYQVVRIYRQSRRVLEEGDNRARAERAYDKAAGGIRDGDLLLYADGVQERAFHGGYNRTRW
jgi:hypothetical protein